MSTRPPNDTPSRHPTEHELRVQLEGAWEVLEQARERQAELLKRLEAHRWLRRLRERPELPRQVREQQPTLREALERAEHRLQREPSSEPPPLRLLLHQLRDQHARMERMVRERLARLGGRGVTSLVEGLERLEAELSEPLPWPPGEDEPVLLSGGLGGLLAVQWGFLACCMLAMLYGALHSPRARWAPTLFFSTLLPVVLLSRFPQTKRFWLTPRRLVWRQFLGGTRQMPLESIPPEGIIRPPSATQQWAPPLQVRGKRTVTFHGLRNLDTLEALLQLHSGPLLRGRVPGAHTYPLAMFPATRRPEGHGPEYWVEQGMIVLRPGQIAFLPEQRLDDMLRALFGTFPTPRAEGHSLPLMMQQLRLLPAEDFDRCVEEAVRASGGERWPAAIVTHGPTPAGGYQFTARDRMVLTASPDASLREVMGGVLHHWPRRA